MIGQRLLHYEILEKLGEGGMGVVYKARDTHLDRFVALKVLPAEKVADASRKARFTQEAKAASALNHPNIIHIYDIATEQDIDFIAMEHVTGKPLDQLIPRQGLRLNEALKIAIQIADALARAHAAGIVHRDLKPSNVMVDEHGVVKLIDFGLAKLLEQSATGEESTVTMAPKTEEGTVVGTAAYLSPERAEGRPTDARSDIFAFGAVLYEMLSGRRAFQGPSRVAILGAVLREEPPPLAENLPPELRRLVERCLRKDPERRYQHFGDVKVALVELKEDSNSGKLAPVAIPRRRLPRSALFFAAGALAMLIVVALFVAVRDGGFGSLTGGGTRLATAAGVTKFTITLAPGQAITSRPAISRDGRVVAFTAGTPTEEPRLYLRRLDDLESRDVPGTNGASQPFFSPDGRSIAFFANGRLFRWTIGGGAPVWLAEAPAPLGGTWGDDNTIVFVPVWNSGLSQLPGSGGTAEPLLRPDGKQGYAFVFPRFIPGRQEILFTVWGKDFGVWRLNLSSQERTKVLQRGSGMVTTSGHLLAGVGDQSPESMGLRRGLLAAPYREGAPLSHTPTLLVPGVSYQPRQPDLWSDVSDTGTLAYVPADVRAQSVVLVDMTGKIEPLSSQRGTYTGVSVSRTSLRIVAAADDQVWLLAPDGASRERLAPENRDWDEQSAKWTPDGKAVIYTSNESGNWDIYRRVPGASKSDVLLAKELDQWTAEISPDGTIAYVDSHPVTGNDIWLLDPDGKTRPWLVSARNEMPVRFSSDGKWLAYRSDESGREEIYVKPVAGDATRLQVSTAGGFNAAWSPKGNTLYYHEAGAMWAVDLGRADIPVPGPRRKLFEGGRALSPIGNWDWSDFDIMPDGERFVMIRREPKAIPDRIHVVVNWYDELRRLVPVK